MRAFEIYRNGEKLGVTGSGDDEVLSAIVNWVAGKKYAADLLLRVGGLISPADEHVSWIRQMPLAVGDEIQVRVVEAKSVDKPTRRHKRDPVKDLRAQKNYVRRMAKQLGWRIETKPAKSASGEKR